MQRSHRMVVIIDAGNIDMSVHVALNQSNMFSGYHVETVEIKSRQDRTKQVNKNKVNYRISIIHKKLLMSKSV